MSVSTALSAGVLSRRSNGRAKRIPKQADEAVDHLATRVIIFILVVSLCAGFCVWIKLSIVKLGYDLSRTRQLHQSVLIEQRKLVLETGSLKSPKRLSVVAEEKLGLTSPSENQIIYVKR